MKKRNHPKKGIYFHGSRKKKAVALTFDDGPSDKTHEILKILAKHNAKATFFVKGNRVEKHKKQIKNILKQGSEIGNHTYNHKRVFLRTKKQIREQILKSDKAIGFKTKLFRPPYLMLGSNVISVANELGKKIIIGDIVPNDWKKPGVDKVVKRCLKAKNGSILVMHECRNRYDIFIKDTVLVLKKLIPELKKKYKLVTVSELLKTR